MLGDRMPWEEEIFYGHRWGAKFWTESGVAGRGQEEYARLRALWDAAQPMDETDQALVSEIVALEICNYRLEESILALCEAIGAHRKVDWPVGHWRSVNEARWKTLWAYYIGLLDWLPAGNYSGLPGKRTGYAPALAWCDPDGEVAAHIRDLLGEPSLAKQLLVQLFAMRIGWWIGGEEGQGDAARIASDAAFDALAQALSPFDPDPQILKAIKSNLQPCHCKLCRRYDIIISSIGAGEWRATMPVDGTGRAVRDDLLDVYLDPIQHWLDGISDAGEHPDTELFQRLQSALGEPDPAKRFLASLLVSLLRSQQRKASVSVSP